MASAPAVAGYTVLGRGSFGAVVEPAFPNIDEAGNPVEFPGYVTKAFFREANQRKALQNAEDLQRKVPSMHIPYNTYTRKMYMRNLPQNLQEKMTQKNRPVNVNAELHMIRMPNKGYNLGDILKNPARLAAYMGLPIGIKVAEIYKLLNIVKATKDAGFVHRDIREPNILINPTTGTMTIIDFDLLKRSDEILKKTGSKIFLHLNPYYNIPPETALFSVYEMPKEDPSDPSQSWLTKFFQMLGHYCYNTAAGQTPVYILVNTIFREWKAGIYPTGALSYSFHTAFAAGEFEGWVLQEMNALRAAILKVHNNADLNTETKKEKKGLILKEFMEKYGEILIDTADSFSLAFCLRFFFTGGQSNYMSMLDGSENDELIKFLVDTLCPNMMHGDPTKRFKIEDAIEEFRKFALKEFKIDLDPASTKAAADIAAAEAARLAAEAGCSVKSKAPWWKRMMRLSEAKQGNTVKKPWYVCAGGGRRRTRRHKCRRGQKA